MQAKQAQAKQVMPKDANVRGRFIVIEGIDGAGKSLQTQKLQQLIEQTGIECIATFEPGGSRLGEEIRAWLLQHETDAITEALLFNAARREHARSLIVPALSRGAWVVCDRFALSGLAYQGAGGANLSALEELHRIALRNIVCDPSCENNANIDMGFLLDLPPLEARARLLAKAKGGAKSGGGAADPFERRGLAFFEQVRARFLECVKKEGDTWHIIDARASREDVTKQIHKTMRRFLTHTKSND